MTSRLGQVYIGVIVSLGIFMILSQAVITLVISGYDLISYNRARTTAKHLATEQIEIIHNLDYNNIGTVGGIPPGIIPQTEEIARNSLAYTVKTTIVYIDDPFDTLAPTDENPNDYKKVRVEVTWGGLADSKSPVILSTNIAPQALEESVGGTLQVLVSNSHGEPIPNANVTITTNEVNPPINTTIATDINGLVTLPDSPPCVSCYHISATRDGMNTDRTYGTDEISTPFKSHLSVQDNYVSEVTLTIDTTGTLNITSLNNFDNNFALLPNQTFRLHGTKIIGTDSLGQFVYKFDEDVLTDGSAQATIENIEWDSYYIGNPTNNTRDISATNPINPIIINPGDTISAIFATTPTTDHRLLTIFVDNTGTPVSSVSAHLSDGLGFEETLPTGEATESANFGQAFFDSLNEFTYFIEATASGYIDYSSDVLVTGYMTETIQLESE